VGAPNFALDAAFIRRVSGYGLRGFRWRPTPVRLRQRSGGSGARHARYVSYTLEQEKARDRAVIADRQRKLAEREEKKPGAVDTRP
jgi:hypothetical protein